MSNDELDSIASHFRALGEPMRLRILHSICVAPKTVSQIVTETKATQTNISKHLALLAAAGIVARSKSGSFVFYRLKDGLTLKLCQLVRLHARLKKKP